MANDTKNVTTKFKVDISDLKKNITEANSKIKLARAEFKNATAGMDNWSKSADGLTAKIKSQNAIVDAEKSKLNALKTQLERLNQSQKNGEKTIANLTAKYEKVVETYGATSKEAKEYAAQLDKAKAAQQRNADAAKDLNLKIIEQDTAVKNAESQLGKYQTKLSDVQNKSETLTEKIARQESELKDLKTQYANVAAEQGKTSEEAQVLAQKITDLSGDLKDNKDKLDAAADAADDLDKAYQDTSKDGISVFSVALGNLVANVVTGAIQKFKDLAKFAAEAYKEVDAGSDNVIKATGATGAQAEALKTAYKNVAKSFKGDFATIGSVVGEVNTRFGYTGEQLESTTKDFLRFADVTGTDAVTAVSKVSRALKAAGMDDRQYSELLDQMTAAAQKSGISVDTLTEGLTKNGATFRQMGFDTTDTIAILSQFEAAGVNTETVLAGMKTAAKNWAKEGKDAREEFGRSVDAIKAAPTDVEKTQKAIEIFGSKAGPELADAIGTGRTEYGAFVTDLKNSQGTVQTTYENTQDAFDQIDIAIQNVKTSFADFVGDLLGEYGPELKKGFKIIGDAIKSVVGFIFDFTKALGETFGEIYLKLEKLWGYLKKFVGWLADNLLNAFDKIDLTGEYGKEQYEKATGKKLTEKEWKDILEQSGFASGGHFATGGIVTRATNALIGENGAEAVIPLEQNTGGLKKIAALLAREMLGTGATTDGAGSAGQTITYNFNQTNNSPKALSRWDIYRQTQNLIDAAKGV